MTGMCHVVSELVELINGLSQLRDFIEHIDKHTVEEEGKMTLLLTIVDLTSHGL